VPLLAAARAAAVAALVDVVHTTWLLAFTRTVAVAPPFEKV